MALEAQLQPLTLPDGTEFPGTPQELLTLIAEYMAITGLAGFDGINIGDTTPDASNRDRPWFRTNAGGVVLGWYAWNGAAWTLIPLTMPSGGTRPASPQEGQQFYDTTIKTALIFAGGAWRTLTGSPGDVKFVKANTIEDALANNPGWVQDPDSLGRSIAAAGSGPGLTPRTYNETAGVEEQDLAIAQIPSHTHDYTNAGSRPRWSATGNVAAPGVGNLCGFAADETLQTEATPATGSEQEGVSMYSPTIWYWALLKSYY